MARRVELRITASETLEILGPTNSTTGLSITGSTTSVAYLIDPRYQLQCGGQQNPPASLLVTDTDPLLAVPIFEAGDGCLIWQQDGTIHESTVNQLLSFGFQIDDVTTAAVDENSRIEKLVGAAIPLTEFGVTKLPDDESGEWGYRGVKGVGHLGLTVGQLLTIVYYFDGGVGAVREFRQDAIVVSA